VTNSCAALYQTPPKRTVISEWAEAYQEWASNECLDEHLQAVERYGFLCGVLAVVPVWDDAEKRVALDLITPDKLDVIENPYDRANPLAIIVQWPEPDAEDTAAVEGKTSGGIPNAADSTVRTVGAIYTRPPSWPPAPA
jgi:hypothetical protein